VQHGGEGLFDPLWGVPVGSANWGGSTTPQVIFGPFPGPELIGSGLFASGIGPAAMLLWLEGSSALSAARSWGTALGALLMGGRPEEER
jgi:hypothetical protein